MGIAPLNPSYGSLRAIGKSVHVTVSDTASKIGVEGSQPILLGRPDVETNAGINYGRSGMPDITTREIASVRFAACNALTNAP